MPLYKAVGAELTNLVAADGASGGFVKDSEVSTYARSFLDDANEAAFKATVNLEANTDFYAPSGTDVAVADGGTGASTARAAAANLSAWHVLQRSGAAASVTATTSEEILATITIPAGAMGPNGVLRITYLQQHTNGADDKIMRVRLGGISGSIMASRTETATAQQVMLCMIFNRNAQNSQIGTSGGSTGGLGSGTGITTAAVDTSAQVDLVITGQKETSGDTLTLAAYVVELAYGA